MTDITLAGLTEGSINGDGVFDVLMKAVKAHLQEEFNAGRIKNSDYANVYLGSIVAVLQQAVQFYLQEEISNKQIEQITAQILQTEAQTNLLVQKLETEKAQTEGSIQREDNGWAVLDSDDEEYVGGTLGRQMVLHATQADGFLRDAEQKAADKLINTWSVRRGTDSGVAATTEAKMMDAHIGAFVSRMASGVGLDLPDYDSDGNIVA